MEYKKIRNLNKNQKSTIEKECKNDYKYISRLPKNKQNIIAKYVRGDLMGVRSMSNIQLNYRNKTRYHILSEILKDIIFNNKPRDSDITVFQGQIENYGDFEVMKNDVHTRPNPFSTSMYYPVAIEWVIEKLYPIVQKYNKNRSEKQLSYMTKNFKHIVLYVYTIPKQSQISLYER